MIPYTDRLNYVSPLINNVGYVLAVEKLFDVQVPERCQYIRVLVSELSRITDHLTCIAANAMELGAFTVFFYFIKAREEIWRLVEAICGARLTTTYTRVGGVMADLPEGFPEHFRTYAGDPARGHARRGATCLRRTVFFTTACVALGLSARRMPLL